MEKTETDPIKDLSFRSWANRLYRKNLDQLNDSERAVLQEKWEEYEGSTDARTATLRKVEQAAEEQAERDRVLREEWERRNHCRRCGEFANHGRVSIKYHCGHCGHWLLEDPPTRRSFLRALPGGLLVIVFSAVIAAVFLRPGILSPYSAMPVLLWAGTVWIVSRQVGATWYELRRSEKKTNRSYLPGPSVAVMLFGAAVLAAFTMLFR